MSTGSRIKTLRLKQGITQEELAKAAKTTKQTIHKYEAGIIKNIPADKIKAIADKLSTTPDYLMAWEMFGSNLSHMIDVVDIISIENGFSSDEFLTGKYKFDSITADKRDLLMELISKYELASTLYKRAEKPWISTAPNELVEAIENIKKAYALLKESDKALSKANEQRKQAEKYFASGLSYFNDFINQKSLGNPHETEMLNSYKKLLEALEEFRIKDDPEKITPDFNRK